MDNFIRVYQNAFSNELCDRLISKFESTELKKETRHDLGEMHFSQVNFTKKWLETRTRRTCSHIFFTHKKIYSRFKYYIRVSRKICTRRYTIKKYSPDGYDQFGFSR